MEAFNNIIKNKGLLSFDDERWEQTFIGLLPKLAQAFKVLQEKGLDVDFNKIFENSIYSLTFQVNPKLVEEGAEGRYWPSENKIDLQPFNNHTPERNEHTIAHEFIHYIKTQIEKELDL